MRAARLPRGLRRARGDGDARARAARGRRARPILFELAAEHDRDRLTSGIWERALEHGDKLATKLIDRAVARPRRRHRLGGQPARRRGGDHRRRPRRALRRALPRADRQRRCSRTCSTTTRPPAVHARRPRRPRRRARRDAARRLMAEPRPQSPRHRKRRCRATTSRARDTAQQTAPADAARQARLAGRAGARRPRHAASSPSAPAAPHAAASSGSCCALLAVNWLSVLLFQPASGQPRVTVPFSPYFLEQVKAGQGRARSPPRATRSRAPSRPRSRYPPGSTEGDADDAVRDPGADVLERQPADGAAAAKRASRSTRSRRRSSQSLLAELLLGFGPTLLIVGLFVLHRAPRRGRRRRDGRARAASGARGPAASTRRRSASPSTTSPGSTRPRPS